MTSRRGFWRRFTEPDCGELLARYGQHNPFCTQEYARAMQALGSDLWIIGYPEEASIALAAIRRGRLGASLDLPSLPAVAATPEFWVLVDGLSRENGITDISAGTFGSPEFELPPLRGELWRQIRQEYIIDLRRPDLFASLSSSHRQNVRKGRKAGLEITGGRVELLPQHLALIATSKERRVERGESISATVGEAECRAYLEKGAGQLFQAVCDSEVLSSVLVLRAPTGAYSHSSGNCPEGMKIGASHFLLHQISLFLQAGGVSEFNLGGAPPGSSLAYFKQAFGASPVSLSGATCFIGKPWQRKLRNALRMARSDRRALVQALAGSCSRLVVFGTDTRSNLAPVTVANTCCCPLTADQVAALPHVPENPEFRHRNQERLRRFGESYAHAVYVDGCLAHVSWLLSAEAAALEEPRILILRPDDAEITGCETLAAFRGRGIYGFAIQQLCAIARAQGMRRVFMKTNRENVASQRGIIKAGLKPIGTVDLVRPPFRPAQTVIRRNIAWP